MRSPATLSGLTSLSALAFQFCALLFAFDILGNHWAAALTVASQLCSALVESQRACYVDTATPHAFPAMLFVLVSLFMSLLTMSSGHVLPAFVGAFNSLLAAKFVDLRYTPCATACAVHYCDACVLLHTASARQDIVLALCLSAACHAVIALCQPTREVAPMPTRSKFEHDFSINKPGSTYQI